MKNKLLLFLLLALVNSAYTQEDNLTSIYARLDNFKVSGDTASYKKLIDSLNEVTTVRKVCGVPFGTDVIHASELLYKKFGRNADHFDANLIVYYSERYNGILFNSIAFDFESESAYRPNHLNAVVLSIGAYSLSDAQEKLQSIATIYGKKYPLSYKLDSNENIVWYGGIDPTDEKLCGFYIFIKEANSAMKREYPTYPYWVKIQYGPYSYVKVIDDSNIKEDF